MILVFANDSNRDSALHLQHLKRFNFVICVLFNLFK